MSAPAIPEQVLELRGWTAAAADRLGLGWAGERVLIPVRDGSADEPLGFLRYSPNGGHRKMLADAGTTRELFPPPEDVADDELNGLLWLVEGEPDAIRLWSLGLVAVAVPGTGKWRDEWAVRFAGRRCRVVVCFDCDASGRKAAERAALALVEAGVDARVLDLDPDRDDGFDLTDFTAEARTNVDRAAAKRLLADMAANASPAAERAVPELASLLAGAEAFCRRFLATLSDDHFCLLALWVAHTYVIGAAETTPYLHVTSAEPESGKTRLLEVLDVVACRAQQVLDPSGASLYRGLHSGEIGTLLIDEVDNFLPGGKADSDAKRTIVGILNGGYRRGMRVPRVTDGRNLDWFEPFGPKALTGLGRLPQTLESRSLRFRMRRRRRDGEPIERFRRKRALIDAAPLVAAFAAWATEAVTAELEAANPPMPDALGDRQQDACELLVAIADRAGGTWPAKAREALVHVLKAAREADAAESRGTVLLADLREAFQRLGDRAATAALLDHLNALDERPWGAWNDGAGLRARNLAGLLRPFDVRPGTVRLADETTAKGYKREDFSDAFARYLAAESVTSVTSAQPCGSEPLSIRHVEGRGDGNESAANPHGYADVTDVTDTGQGERVDADEIERSADLASAAQRKPDDAAERGERGDAP